MALSQLTSLLPYSPFRSGQAERQGLVARLLMALFGVFCLAALAVYGKQEWDAADAAERAEVKSMFEARVALVTGGDSPLGQALVEGLVRKHVTVCVFLQKHRQGYDNALEKAEVRSKYDLLVARKQVVLYEGDTFTWQGAQAAVSFVDQTFKRLDILVNAATQDVPDPVQAEGQAGGLTQGVGTKLVSVSEEFVTNVLLHYRLIYASVSLLARTQHLEGSKHGRIVQVASLAAGGADFRDLAFSQRFPTPQAVFESNMHVLRMFPQIWKDKLAPFGITINSCHPGAMVEKTRKGHGIYRIFRGGKQAFAGGEAGDIGIAVTEGMRKNVETCIEVATSPRPDIASVTGKWYVDGKQAEDEFAQMEHDRAIVANFLPSLDGLSGELTAPKVEAGGGAVAGPAPDVVSVVGE